MPSGITTRWPLLSGQTLLVELVLRLTSWFPESVPRS